MRINEATVALVKKWEGLGDGDKATPGLQPYICPAGYWTIGYGRVILSPEGEMLKSPSLKAVAYAAYPAITEPQADIFLREDLDEYGQNILKWIKVPLTENQYGALVAFAYNVGVGAFRASTLLKKLNARDYAGAADQFLVWDKITDPKTGKKVALRGLTNRRTDERNLFLS